MPRSSLFSKPSFLAMLAAALCAPVMAAPAEPAGKPATAQTAQSNRAWLDKLPFAETDDAEAARKGLIARFPQATIARDGGGVAWDFNAYRFTTDKAAPDTVNPSLWRLAQLNNEAGLFQVADKIYQVRGADLSNMTIVEGDTGVIVIDPLLSAETARAALELYFQHRPRRPVVAMIYTHSHVDHFGGARGVVSEAAVRAGKVAILAPAGFEEEAVSENVVAGNAMSRRAQYMYGTALPRDATGQVDAGLGKATSRGTITLLPPTETIDKPVETRRIDGLEIEFQLTPGTEAPAEMNLYFPATRVLCMAENTVRTQHNILTIRGAQVRDPKAWSHYIAQSLQRYGDRTDVLLAQHHWPTWGRERIVEFLSDQRDMYAWIHDQSVRLINHGMTPNDISATLRSLPGPLARKWHTRDYYGSVSHNVRAVYQRYLGFYDGNPANLNPLPPVETARRTIEWMGGPEQVLARLREAYAKGDYRWVVQIGNALVFANPDNAQAKALQADALEQLGYQSENATWRNAYLTGARELRHGVSPKGRGTASPDMVRALTVPHFFDYLAVRLNSDRAGTTALQLNWNFRESGAKYAMTLRNGALTWLGGEHAKPTATVTLDKATLDRIVLKEQTLPEAVKAGAVNVQGDASALRTLFGLLDNFDSAFPIVTPRVADKD
ncbi:alkyl/aryl-sulfatase [Paracidovorax citrulli]